MSKLKTEFVAHHEGPMPLYLDDGEMNFEKTDWFKSVVAKVRWTVCGAHTGEWKISQIKDLIGCMLDIDTIDENFAFVDKHQMKRSYDASKGDGMARRFVGAFLEGNYDEATDALIAWCSRSIKFLFDAIEYKCPHYFDRTWVIVAASLVATPETTMLTLKVEQRFKSISIPKKKALSIFIEECIGISEYWGNCAKNPKEAADGAIFSMLNLIDGSRMEMPAMDLVLRPHPEDKAYCIDAEEDYFEDGMVINDETMLHEEYCAVKDK